MAAAADAEAEVVPPPPPPPPQHQHAIHVGVSGENGNRCHCLLIGDTDYTALKNASQGMRDTSMIRRLCVRVVDPHTEKHCKYLTTLLRGLAQNPRVRLRDMIIAGVHFGAGPRCFGQLIMHLKLWMLTSNSLRMITIEDCNFRSISQLLGIGQSIASSRSIRDITFRDVDFTAIDGNRALAISYLNAAFTRHVLSGTRKDIHFQNCTMQNRHVVELVRGVSGSNHPRTFSVEGGNTQIDTYACALLNEELLNHDESTGSISCTAHETTYIPPITLLSLEGVRIGDGGVSTLLLMPTIRRKDFGFVRLNLSRCGITDEGCRSIAAVLRDNRAPFLRDLLVEDNDINDEGAISIAWALSQKSHIRCIRMGNSRGCITNESFLAFYHLVFNDCTPNHVEKSNFSVSRLTLDCRQQHKVAVPGKTSERLERVLCINANCQLMGKSTRLTAKREKLFDLIYNRYLDFGEGHFLNELFPGTQTSDTASALRHIYLFLRWISLYHQHRGLVIQDNPVTKNNEYWTGQANSTRELTLLYSAVRIRVSTVLRTETRYNFRSTTKWARLVVNGVHHPDPHATAISWRE